MIQVLQARPSIEEAVGIIPLLATPRGALSSSATVRSTMKESPRGPHPAVSAYIFDETWKAKENLAYDYLVEVAASATQDKDNDWQ